MRRFIQIVTLVPALAGCSSIRASSRNKMDERSSILLVDANKETARDQLTKSFNQRGCDLLDQKEQSEGTLRLKFKGRRSTVTTVSGYIGQYGGSVGSSSDVIGSVYYAMLIPRENATYVRLLGKPTHDGKEICSDHDNSPFLKTDPCEDFTAWWSWSGRNQMTGLEESELIRGVKLELQNSGVARPLPPRPPFQCEDKPGETKPARAIRCREEAKAASLY
jgi:hypothetical protein